MDYVISKSMKELVKDTSWQKVRGSLVGKWKEKPTWCCSQLRDYLGSVGSASEDKLRIVRNYLTGTGFRTGRIKHTCISSLRKEISLEWSKRKEE